MAEIKVGQTWQWFSDSPTTFEVLSIENGKAKIRYDYGLVSTWALKEFDEQSVLVKDVEEQEPVADAISPEEDAVNHPSHYTSDPSGVECIQITRHRNFNVGNAIKYLWRAGLKKSEGRSEQEKQIEDLKKAVFYIQDEIKRLES